MPPGRRGSGASGPRMAWACKIMLVQEDVGGVPERRHAAWESHDLPHRDPSIGVVANAGSSSLPRRCDRPGPDVGGGWSPQQIGALPPQPRSADRFSVSCGPGWPAAPSPQNRGKELLRAVYAAGDLAAGDLAGAASRWIASTAGAMVCSSSS
jgi:hypothetical protein